MQLALNGAGVLSGVGGPAPGLRSNVPAQAPPAATAAGSAALLPVSLPAVAEASLLPAATRSLLALPASFQSAVAGGQQASVYLQNLAGQLQSLKSDLSAKLASNAAPDAALEARLDRLAVTWLDRQNAAGGSLDGQLGYSSPPQAMQRFSIRGLSVASLQAGDKETISLALNSAGQRMVTVSTVPGLSAGDIVQRFQEALGPAGVQVSTDASDASGTLIFSVPEAGWTAVRDSLQIKGNGVRFAAGQLVRVRADPEPDAVQPATWAVSDGRTMRLTLQNVTRASALVQQAQAAASADLSAASAQLDAAPPAGDADWAARAALGLAALAGRDGYPVTASLRAAVSGVQRSRVVSLLALPVTPSAAR